MAGLSREQERVLDVILGVGRDEHATAKELKAAVETGWVESKLRNLRYGDADSQGWRQERRSLYPDPTSVVHSARRFFREARARRGKYGTAGALAAAVQRPRADKRGLYQDVSGLADELLRGVGGAPAHGRVPGTSGRAASAQGGVTLPDGSNVSVAALLGLLQGADKPAPPEVPMPSFAAGPTLPQGYQPVAPAQHQDAGPSISDLLALVRTQPQDAVPLTSAQGNGSGAPSGPSSTGGGRRPGRVVVAPGANRTGVPLTPGILRVVRAVAGVAGKTLTIGTGSNHNPLTKRGTVSDHRDGNAADIPASGDELTRLGQAALIAAGVPRAQALKARGGIYNVPYGKHRRIQIIFHAPDHEDHLHVGVTAR